MKKIKEALTTKDQFFSRKRKKKYLIYIWELYYHGLMSTFTKYKCIPFR